MATWFTNKICRPKSTIAPLINLVIISGLLFVVGNAAWYFIDEPKLYWLPLSLFLSVMVCYIYKIAKEKEVHYAKRMFLVCLSVLSVGNFVKQAFYTEGIFQWNDFIWGGIVITAYLITIAIWVIRNQHSGKKLRSS